MILLQAIYFCTLLKKLLCNTTGVDTIAKLKAILSPQRSPPQSQTLKVLSLCITPAFTIRSSVSCDDGKCPKMWQSAERLVQLIVYSQTQTLVLGKLPFSVVISSLCDHFHRSESQSAVHVLVKSMLASRTGFPSMTAWTIRCDDLLYGCSALSNSDLYIPGPLTFCTLILFFCFFWSILFRGGVDV